MTLEQLKNLATAGEMLLIEQVERLVRVEPAQNAVEKVSLLAKEFMVKNIPCREELSDPRFREAWFNNFVRAITPE